MHFSASQRVFDGAGIVHDHFVVLYLVPDHVEGEQYQAFLREMLLELLHPIPETIKSGLEYDYNMTVRTSYELFQII